MVWPDMRASLQGARERRAATSALTSVLWEAISDAQFVGLLLVLSSVLCQGIESVRRDQFAIRLARSKNDGCSRDSDLHF